VQRCGWCRGWAGAPGLQGAATCRLPAPARPAPPPTTHPARPPTQAASHGFLVNLDAVLLKLCGPFMDPSNPHFWARTDIRYATRPSRISFEGGRRRAAAAAGPACCAAPGMNQGVPSACPAAAGAAAAAGAEQPLPLCPPAGETKLGVDSAQEAEWLQSLQGQPVPEWHFICECFFMTLKALHLGVLKCISDANVRRSPGCHDPRLGPDRQLQLAPTGAAATGGVAGRPAPLAPNLPTPRPPAAPQEDARRLQDGMRMQQEMEAVVQQVAGTPQEAGAKAKLEQVSGVGGRGRAGGLGAGLGGWGG
jgi:hypothetical protein